MKKFWNSLSADPTAERRGFRHLFYGGANVFSSLIGVQVCDCIERGQASVKESGTLCGIGVRVRERLVTGASGETRDSRRWVRVDRGRGGD